MKLTTICNIVFIVLIFGCNNAGENKKTVEVKSHTDSLMDEVMEGHDAAMGKTNKISAAQKAVQQSLDSVNKLPAKSAKNSVAFKTKLDSLSGELQYASSAMDKWMEEFNMDSARNDLKLREAYLDSEKEKVFKIRDLMVTALSKTDSVLKNRP